MTAVSAGRLYDTSETGRRSESHSSSSIRFNASDFRTVAARAIEIADALNLWNTPVESGDQLVQFEPFAPG
jgi:hypothetical protein